MNGFFWPCSYSVLLPYCVACKIQVQTRQKIQFIKLEFSKIKWRSIGGLKALITNLLIHACCPWGCRSAMHPQILADLNQGGQIMPTKWYWYPRIFRLSDSAVVYSKEADGQAFRSAKVFWRIFTKKKEINTGWFKEERKGTDKTEGTLCTTKILTKERINSLVKPRIFQEATYFIVIFTYLR